MSFRFRYSASSTSNSLQVLFVLIFLFFGLNYLYFSSSIYKTDEKRVYVSLYDV